jgi:carbon monoxide dehydrogenase subunit G
MAYIRMEVKVNAAAATVWDAVRDPAALHTRLVPGLVSHTVMDGDTRVVTFANGVTVRERIIDVDDAERRLVWSIIGAPVTHHQGVMQVFEDGPQACRVSWDTDILPAALAERARPNMEMGLAIVARVFSQAGG